MRNSATSRPVVVGIDGSKHAVRAAVWAVDEAVSRHTTLRLVHVINQHVRDRDRGYAYAEHILHKAWAAVEGTGKPVKIQSQILEGDPAAELVEVSRKAEIICVGSKGTNNSTRQERGSTAAELAQRAHCPVAIIRRRHPHRPMPSGLWIVVALDESPDSHSVLQTALDEAGLREAPVLALTPWSSAAGEDELSDEERDLRAMLKGYLDTEEYEDADVKMCTLPKPTNMSNLLAQSATIDQLVIVGSSNPDLIAEVVGPEARSILAHTNCSVLILRRAPIFNRAPGPLVHQDECDRPEPATTQAP